MTCTLIICLLKLQRQSLLLTYDAVVAYLLLVAQGGSGVKRGAQGKGGGEGQGGVLVVYTIGRCCTSLSAAAGAILLLVAGSRRGIGVNEERDQTLNQLLTELDGFEGREGVLLLAATNRAEVGLKL